MTLAVAHRSRDGKVILDAIREQRAPFDPDAVVRQFAGELRRFGIREVVGDHYAGAWPESRFRAFGIHYRTSDRDKSEIYRLNIPLLMAAQVELLDLPVLSKQILNLDRRTTRTGKELIDHSRGQRDDVVNAACGALLEASEIGTRATVAVIAAGSAFDPSSNPDSPHWWGAKYYGIRPPRSAAALAGLVEAPPPWYESDAMREIRAQNAKDEEEAREHSRRIGHTITRGGV
jgi:hypothetical protein